jgi:hypothetical protein
VGGDLDVIIDADTARPPFELKGQHLHHHERP